MGRFVSNPFLAVSIIGDFSLPATGDIDSASGSPLPAPTYIFVIGTIESSSLAIFKEVSYLFLPITATLFPFKPNFKSAVPNASILLRCVRNRSESTRKNS